MHEPQPTVRRVPQLSAAVMDPQSLPSMRQRAVSLAGVQTPWPQTFGVPPPPQLKGLLHCPQLMMLPQVSDISPQLIARSAQVFGSQDVPPSEGSGKGPQALAARDRTALTAMERALIFTTTSSRGL